MITRPVAVARALIVTAVVWLLGAGLTVGSFAWLGADTTIDVLGEENRVQIVWLGAHALSTCVASLLGVGAGGTALARSHADPPGRAARLVALATLAGAAAAVGVLAVAPGVRTATALALLGGLLIGCVAGAAYVLQRDPDEDSPYPQRRRATGRAWSSR
jgi:hypothetical protein